MDSSEWRLAITKLYAVFARYSRPQSMHAAEKHDVKKVMARLMAAPLRDLAAENLGAYAASALYTIGDLGEYKHFLPRILDLSLTSTGWIGLDPEVIANKLNYTKWQQWPSDEKTAIQGAFKAGWRSSRNVSPDIREADSMLYACSAIGENIAPLLSDWLPLGSSDSVLQLAHLVRISQNIDEDVYWREAPEPVRDLLVAWTGSRSVREALVTGKALVSTDDQWQVDQALA